MPQVPEFTIGIASLASEADDAEQLRPELNLLKAALLYGDRATLTSTVVSAFGASVNHWISDIVTR